jgi:hypothetical protein
MKIHRYFPFLRIRLLRKSPQNTPHCVPLRNVGIAEPAVDYYASCEEDESPKMPLTGQKENKGLPDVTYNDAEHFVDEACGTGVSRWTLIGTPAAYIS